MFCIAAGESQFQDRTNIGRLRELVEKIDWLRRTLAANRICFAGILPGVLIRNRILRNATEADLTAHIVCEAVRRVKHAEALSADGPVILLGGRGFIGRRVARRLNCSAHILDRGEQRWPLSPQGAGMLAVNLMPADAMDQWLSKIPAGTVIVNEAYPPPVDMTLVALRNKRCKCYHIVGVKAYALPAFPKHYAGAVPCCAAWPATDLKVVVRRIV
jgi:hypothetical protein